MNKKYSYSGLAEACKNSTSVAGAMRLLGIVSQNGGTHAYVSRLIRSRGIDTAHFTGQAYKRGQISWQRKPASEVLVLGDERDSKEDTARLRRVLIESGVIYECSSCGCGPLWQGRQLVIQIDHIDGRTYDNRIENLRFLCPNCHSQTDTFGAKNTLAVKNRRDRVAAAALVKSEKLRIAEENPTWAERNRLPRPGRRRVDYASVIEAAKTNNYNRVAKMFSISWNAVKKIVEKYSAQVA